MRWKVRSRRANLHVGVLVRAFWLLGLVGCVSSGLRSATTDAPNTETLPTMSGVSETHSTPPTGLPSGVDTGTTAPTTSTTTPSPVDTAAAPPWSHAIGVDGQVGDWLPEETLPSALGTVRLTWDAAGIFVAVTQADLTTGGPMHWVVLSIGDGGAGASAGLSFQTQTPALAVPATRALRWKMDGSYNGFAVWDGVAWSETPNYLGTGGSTVAEDNASGTLELLIPRSALGLGDTMTVALGLVYEGVGSESTYGASPPGTFPEGSYDPDWTTAWQFDLTASAPPSAAIQVP
jgi:hypothetical protein